MFKPIQADFFKYLGILVLFVNSLEATGSNRGGIWMNRKATGTLSRYFPQFARLAPTQFLPNSREIGFIPDLVTTMPLPCYEY
jgi:hypothetical protein